MVRMGVGEVLMLDGERVGGREVRVRVRERVRNWKAVAVKDGLGVSSRVVESGQGSEVVVGSGSVEVEVHDTVSFPQVVVLLRWVVTAYGVAVTETVMLTVSVRVVTTALQLEDGQGPTLWCQKEPPPRCPPMALSVVLTKTTLGSEGVTVAIAPPVLERVLNDRNPPDGAEDDDETPEGPGGPTNAGGIECILWWYLDLYMCFKDLA